MARRIVFEDDAAAAAPPPVPPPPPTPATKPADYLPGSLTTSGKVIKGTSSYKPTPDEEPYWQDYVQKYGRYPSMPDLRAYMGVRKTRDRLVEAFHVRVVECHLGVRPCDPVGARDLLDRLPAVPAPGETAAPADDWMVYRLTKYINGYFDHVCQSLTLATISESQSIEWANNFAARVAAIAGGIDVVPKYIRDDVGLKYKSLSSREELGGASATGSFSKDMLKQAIELMKSGLVSKKSALDHWKPWFSHTAGGGSSVFLAAPPTAVLTHGVAVDAVPEEYDAGKSPEALTGLKSFTPAFAAGIKLCVSDAVPMGHVMATAAGDVYVNPKYLPEVEKALAARGG